MLDVKELFTPSRRRLLRGEPEPDAPSQLGSQCLPLSWRRFPDPAASSLLQSHACRAWDVLGICEASLRLCHKNLHSNRDALRQCRTQLEAHLACGAAVRDLLAGRWSDPQDEDWVSDTISRRPAVASRPRHCVGRVRCFFCRERDSLEREEGEFGGTSDPWDLDSAVLGDVSCATSSDSFRSMRASEAREAREAPEGARETAGAGTSEGTAPASAPSSRKVRRRKTSRERGRVLYKLRRKECSAVPTWYATHTVEPEPPRILQKSSDRSSGCGSGTRNGGEGALSQESKSEVREGMDPVEPVELQRPRLDMSQVQEGEALHGDLQGADAADAAELEPYTTAAARFRAEMEFLDMSSFPGSPEVNVPERHKGMERDSPEKALPRPMPLDDIEVWQTPAPPAPPPSASHARARKFLSDGETFEEPSSGPDIPAAWRWTLCTFRLLKEGPVRKLAVLQGWAAAVKRQRTPLASIGAVHQPCVTRPAVPVRNEASMEASPAVPSASR
ncbi:unnamed protein product [Symbiodinium natans]|uniref:Uncharacterized protein n=1 Tax=Symbiodinium natans TaxID=878477 RepID=A0A812UMD7_9DINO|nr:unnamed protein product [Symbiodinium natans]